MRDFPMFTTESGIASLTLREIPYKAEAYIRIQSSVQPDALLKECCDFCVAAGAEKVYATGHHVVTTFPLHTVIWKMERLRSGIPENQMILRPVQEESASVWRSLFNTHMQSVPNSATMTQKDVDQILCHGKGYFVYDGDVLIGLGVASDERIDAIISLIPGMGEKVLSALNAVLTGDKIVVEVASQNERAVAFYKKLGFSITEELSSWYKII